MLFVQALQYVLIPMFQVSFERGEGDALIGGPPSPEQDSNENVVSVFVCKVVDPDKPFGTSVSYVYYQKYECICLGFQRHLTNQTLEVFFVVKS